VGILLCTRATVALMLLVATLVSLPAASLATESADAGSSTDKLPPLIDRELLFGDPEISTAQLSPDGRFIAFIKPLNGTRNIWVKKTEDAFDQARPVTADTKRPINRYFWSRDSRYILYAQDNGGDENFNVYAVKPDDLSAPAANVPAARNLTDLNGVQALIYEVPRSDPDLIYVGLNDRDKAWHDLYSIRISTGERTLLHQNTERIAQWNFDAKGHLRLVMRAAPNGDWEVLRVDPAGLTKIYSCHVLEACVPIHFHICFQLRI
jgi:dipeptidyl aminopeptidase/acylaminoacyl peptidase